MNALVVCDSTNSNTERVALAIDEASGTQVLRVGDVNTANQQRLDLLTAWDSC